MRPLFFDFPEDPESWKVETAYMFGRDLLVSPVTEAGVKVWKVYLPKGSKWTEAATGKEYEGGRHAESLMHRLVLVYLPNCLACEGWGRS